MASNLGSLYYTMFLKDMTDADFKKINDKFKNLGFDITLTPKILKELTQSAVPKGVKIELDPKITSEALQKVAEGKTMKVAVTPLLTGFREAIIKATKDNPPLAEVGVQETKLRSIIQRVLDKQGFMLNVSTVNDNYSKAIQQKLNGRTYTVKIHANANEITRSIQASLMQVQSRYFGLQVSKDILRRSIDEALMGKPFNINIAVQQDQARKAVQDALLRAQIMGKDQALAYQRLQTGELRAAQAELARLRAEQLGAAKAANTHASASINLGGALGSNIKIAGELGAAMASLYSVHAAKQFLSQVIEIGGELEHQKIALETIYGTPSKMESLYGNIKSLARQSPFGVMELTKNVKQLSAYGVAYNEVYDTAKRLADISAATSVDIQRLILAFGKTKNRTFLDGLEAKQFAYANIPIYDALSKKLTELEGKFVSVKDVMGRIKKREIGFDMVKDILWDMTDEGGKFYNMQEKLADSLLTSRKLIKDNFELMLGEIAESSAGDAMKTFFQFIQKLTQEWKTLFAVVASGAGIFGIYKLAVFATNVMMGRMNAANLAQMQSQAKLNASLAKTASMYRNLSAEESKQIMLKSTLDKVNSKNILSNKALTSAEIKLLVAEKALTRDSAARLIAMGKISPIQARYLIQQKLITFNDLRAAVAARKHGLSLNILGKDVKIASFRFKMLGAAIWSSVKALGAMVFNPLTAIMAAVGAGMALWSRNNEEMEKAKEIGDSLFSKAVDSSKEVKSLLETLGSSDALSNLELSQGIEQMENKIKDLSPTPIEDINNSLVAQDGHVRTLAERFDFLKGRLEQVGKAYNAIVNKTDYANNTRGALRATDGGNWFTRLFNDDLITNAKDYTEALKRQEDAIARIISQNKKAMYSGINAALNSDEAFRTATKGIESYEEKLRFLVDNYKKYIAAVNAFNADTARFDNAKTIEEIGNFGQINDAYDELLADTDRFIADLNARLNLNPLTMTEEQRIALTASLKHILDSMEGAGEDAKAVIAKKWEEAWNVVLMEDKIGPAMSAKFKKLMEDSSEEGIETIRKKLVYEGFDKLDKEGQEKVKKMMEDAKGQAMNELSLTNQQMSEYLASHPLEQLIQLVYSDSKNAPSELAKELVSKHGYPGLTNSTDRLVKQWTKSGKMYDSRNAAKESLQAVYSELEAAKKEGGEVQKRAQEAYDEIWTALQYLGWTDLETKDQESNKHTGTKKDTFAEALKQRFKDIKDAWSEFQKWSKTEGRDAAATRIGESGLFSTLSADQIPKTIEDYRTLVKGLEDELRKAGVKGNARESLLNDLLKQLLDIDKTVVDEQLKLALDKVGKEAERQIADWYLFDKIRKATGNQNLAMSIAFGLDSTAETDYPTMIKKQFNEVANAAKSTLTFDTATPELLKEAPEEVQKAWEKAYSEIQKYRDKEREEVADLVAQYRNTQEEIIAITAQAEEKKQKIRENKDLSPVQKQQIIDRIEADLNYQVFQKSGEYLKFFNAILSMTGKEAEDVGKKIKEALDKKLQAGAISAKEYCDEMEKIDKQLDIIRNKQKGFGGFGSFAKGGLSQMFQDRFNQAQSNYNKAVQDFDTAKQQFDIFSQEGNEAGMQQAQSAMDAAGAMKEGAGAAMEGAQGAMKTVAVIDTVVHRINDTVQGIRDTFYSIQDMADSFGVDTSADTGWGAAGAFLDAFSQASEGATKAWDSLKSGNIGGVISGVVQSVTSWFTVFNKWHDAKLQKQIERSQEIVDNIQRAYDKIERRMTNFLGNARNLRVDNVEQDIKNLEKLNKLSEQNRLYSSLTQKTREKLTKRQAAYEEGGAYGYQRQLMTEQLAEMERQKADMEAMKKKDPEAIADLEDQIDEMKIQIRDFALEVAKDLYGIDLNGWAEQLGDTLVEAFARGEDAGEAFDKKVGEILRSISSKMISQDILAPMFGDLRDYLFGKDGTGGAFGSDFQLDPSEMGAMKEYLDKIKNEGIPAAQELFDAINEATGGMLNDTEKSKSGMTKELQSLTENTGDLLASYVNDGRASLSYIRMDLDKFMQESLPQMNVIAEAQLTAQRQIAENTLRTAEAAEAIRSAMSDVTRNQDRLERSWRRIAEKNWGSY